jgi:hypothetical protein
MRHRRELAMEGEMKALFFGGLLLAAQVDTCGHPEARKMMLDTSAQTEKRCQELGGIPIYEMNFDTNTNDYFQTVKHCEFPCEQRTSVPPIYLRGEK